MRGNYRRIVPHHHAPQTVAYGIMGERSCMVAGIFLRLAKGEMKVEADFRRDLAIQRGAHGLPVIGGE